MTRSMHGSPTNPTDCPECGCNFTHHVRDFERWNRKLQERRCDFCDHLFEVAAASAPPDLPPAPAAPPASAPSYGQTTLRLICPWCKSARHRVTRTITDAKTKLPIVRYRQCLSCNKRFRETIVDRNKSSG